MSRGVGRGCIEVRGERRVWKGESFAGACLCGRLGGNGSI